MPAKNHRTYYDYIDLLGKEAEQKAQVQTTPNKPRSNFTTPINPPATKRKSQDEVVQEFWNEEKGSNKTHSNCDACNTAIAPPNICLLYTSPSPRD